MNHFPDEFIAQRKAALLEKQKNLLSEINRLEDEESRDSGSDYSEDDLSQRAQDRYDEGAIEDRLRKDLEKVDAALLRIESSTYGVCGNCQKLIDRARLEALPEAGICLECSR